MSESNPAGHDFRQHRRRATLYMKQPTTDCMEAANDDGSWKDWFEAHGPKLLLCARQWTRSLADAEDVVQEAFVRYWRNQRQLPGDPQALLITSIRRAAWDHARRESRRSSREEKSGDAWAASESYFEPVAGEVAERGQEIESALRRLPVEQREVLVLKIWHERTYEQIAECLGIPLNTAASRYRYALAGLRKELKPVHHG
jgi:RNA polymerase sigma-70 factor, ECF subfamily